MGWSQRFGRCALRCALLVVVGLLGCAYLAQGRVQEAAAGVPSGLGSWALEEVTATADDDVLVQVSGHWLVWARKTGQTGAGIWVRNLDTGAQGALMWCAVPAGHSHSPFRLAVAGDHVIAGYDLGEVKLGDMRSGLVTTLCAEADRGVGRGVANDGHYVAWKVGGADAAILYYDLSAGRVVGRVQFELPEDPSFALESGQLVYIRYVAWPRGRVVLLDVASGQERVLVAIANADSTELKFAGRHVALRRSSGDQLRVVRVSDGMETALSNARTAGFALSSDYLVWTQAADNADMEVFAFDLRSYLLQRLTGNDVWDGVPATKGRWLVWASGEDEAHRAVRVLDLSTGSSEAGVITADTPLPVGLGQVEAFSVSGDRVAWIRRTASGGDVLLATYQAPSSPFTDVKPGHPYFKAIVGLYDEGIISGRQVGGSWVFGPSENLLRAQFAKMICGVMRLPVDETLVPPFNDLGPDYQDNLYPHEYVAAAYDYGITRGIRIGEFGPWIPISRAQLVTMVVRAVQSLYPGALASVPAGFSGALGAFYTDPDHGANMRVAEYNGLLGSLQGFGGAWDPWACASRGETAQILWNVLQVIR